MNRQDLINFNISQKWKKARIEFYENQIETITRVVQVLSDMPKGSRKIYDDEAEKLTELIDKIGELEKEVEDSVILEETKLRKQLLLLEPKHGLLLYHYYIIGDSIKYISNEILHYELKYTYTLKDEALDEFDKICE